MCSDSNDVNLHFFLVNADQYVGITLDPVHTIHSDVTLKKVKVTWAATAHHAMHCKALYGKVKMRHSEKTYTYWENVWGVKILNHGPENVPQLTLHALHEISRNITIPQYQWKRFVL